MSKKKMYLYIWEEVLEDSWPGMVVVLARSISEARKEAADITSYEYTIEYFKEHLPYVYHTDRKKAVGHCVHGGG